MKRLLNSTAALSVALMNANPWPLMAQTLTDAGAVIAADGTVLCEPSADTVCDPENAELIEKAAKIEADMAKEQANTDAEAADAEVKAEAEAQAKADAEAADAQAQADAQAAEEAKLKAEAEAAEAQADAEAADAQAQADAQAAEEAKAKAEAEAAEAQAKADAEAADAQAQADAQAAEEAKLKAEAEAAEAQAEADAEAADAQAQADAQAAEEAKLKAEAEAAEAQAKADAEAADAQAQADAQAAEEAKLKAEAEAAEAKADAEAAEEQAKADAKEADAKAKADAKAVKEQEKADATPAAEADTAEAAPEVTPEEAEARAKAEAELGVKADGTVTDPNAGLKTADKPADPNAEPVEAPVVSEDQMQALSALLAGAAATKAAEEAQDESPIAAAEAGKQSADAEASADAVTSTTETVTKDSARSATEEFAAAPEVVAPGKKSGLSNLEKAGLLGLGALVVGSILKNNANDAGQPQQQVVSNTGDRVVVLQPDGTYQVFKDDDALLRQPGNTVRTESFKDGSSRTVVDRTDGTQIVTIRNATGRVLRRAHYDVNGKETVLFNDIGQEQVVEISKLPKPTNRPVVISAGEGDAAIKAALAQREIDKIGRSFSLRQVREIPQVRHLAAMIGVDNVTFATGSAALTTAQVDQLADLGEVMQQLLKENANELFLIEGHTDATGKAAMNLALSDRRAETVALALTEYFNIPPENMVVQGYGESELLIDTQADEKRNRRVAVRIITPLL
jgi:outer membrane protein OmpA-like peptidoglycan-associated protein